MFKRYSITFIAMLIVFGSLALLPERVEAGSPSCQEVNGMARTPTTTGNAKPALLGLRAQPTKQKPGSGNGETLLRRTASATLSALVLIVGLAGIAYSVRKLLRQMRSARSQQRHYHLGSFTGKSAFAYALLVATLGAAAVIGVALHQAGSTSAEVLTSNRVAAAKYQVAERMTDAPLFTSALEIGSITALWVQIGGTAIDSAGNTFITGGFNGTLTFNTPQQPTTLSSTQELEVFVVKLDPAGHPLWARQATGATGIATGYSLDAGLAIAVDAQGNAYVGGGFVNSLLFKDANGNTVATLGDDNSDINFELFVAKYDAAGTLVWARGGMSDVADDPEAEQDLDAGINGITEVIVDNAGNPYVAGTLTGTNFLGQEIATEGGRDVLLARLNPATGDPVWVSTPGSINTDAVTGMAIDAAANIYIIGEMGGTITFPTQPTPTTFVLEDEFGDSFVAKYNQNGQAIWAKQIGGTQPIDGEHIAVNSAGQFYLTGAFEGTAEFGSITVTDGTQGSGSSAYLAKYTTNGDALWVRVFGHLPGGTTEGDVLGYRVSVDGAGNPYVSGTFEGEAAFGLESPAATQTLMSEGPGDQFILHYGASGDFRWVKQLTGSGIEGENGETGADIPIEVHPMRLVYNNSARAMIMTGDLQGTLALDDFTLNSGSARHAFVAALPQANQSPVAACRNVTVSAGANCQAPASINNNSSDPDGDQITVTQSPAGPYPLGTTSVTLTVTDSQGASSQCAAIVTVNDTTPPSITCPASIVKGTDPNQCSALVNFNPSVSDNCSGVGAVVCSPPSGTSFPKGTTAINCSARDAANNQSTCSFAVTVIDTQAPSVACPANFITNTINAGDRTVAVDFAAPVATDNCPGVSVVCVPPSGSQFPRGVTTVTCNATDASNNQKSCAFTVRVFDYVIVDDTNAKMLRFDSMTGDYDFFDCRKRIALSGRGVVTISFCKTELRDTGPDPQRPDRNLLVQANSCARKGTATLLYANVTHMLNDANLSNNRVSCP